MNCVTIAGTVEEIDPDGFGYFATLAVPRWGPTGREPGVVCVKVRIVGAMLNVPEVGDLVGLTGWVEQAATFEIECSSKMVTVLAARKPT